MSKVFHFLHFLLSITLLMVVLFTIKTETIFAVQVITYKGATLTIDQDTKPITTETRSVNFTVTADREGFFASGQEYRSVAWKGSSIQDGICVYIGNNDLTYPKGTLDPNSKGKVLTFFWQLYPDPCKTELGKWHFGMWAGGPGFMYFVDPKYRDSVVVPGYPFEIEQPTGGTLNLKAINSPLGPDDTPQVMLFNARKENQYEFWWQGSGEFALNIPNTTYPAQDGNIQLDIPKKGIDFSKPGKRTLCMELGDDRFLGTENRISPLINCRLHVDFDFQGVSPPLPAPGPPGSCSIKIYAAHFPTLKKNDSLSAIINNLPTDQEFRTELVSGGQPVIEPIKQRPNKNGLIILDLKDHINIGDYTINTYDADNKQLCTTGVFKVTEEGSAEEAPVCQDQECTTAGKDVSCGDKKDPRGPGIKTAIGCIHTSPAEFVKDFMTFIIGISGGLAFLMMLLGAFQMLTSAGNPDTLHAGRERLTSAVIGLLIVIFATLLLQIIGFDILKIPGFGR